MWDFPSVNTQRLAVSRPLRGSTWPEAASTAPGEMPHDLLFQLNAVHVVDSRPHPIEAHEYTRYMICGGRGGVDAGTDAAESGSSTSGAVLASLEYEPLMTKTDREAQRWNTDAECSVFLFGVDPHGHPVCVYVTGFKPYFYVELKTPATGDDEDLRSEARALKTRVLTACRLQPGAIECAVVTSFRAYGFVPKTRGDATERRKFKFLRIALPTMNHWYRARKNLLEAPGLDIDDKYLLCQENVTFSTQFNLIADICASEWVVVAANKHKIFRYQGDAMRFSHASIERSCEISAVCKYVAPDPKQPLPSMPLVVYV
jgi:hypothetical protein